MKARLAALAIFVTLAATNSLLGLGQESSTRFPHEKHARLFPVCEGCHGGIVSGSVNEVFPEAEDCQRCHDGTRAKIISWQKPTAARISNLKFSHSTHHAAAGQDSFTCLTCHASTSPPRRMEVAGPDPDLCVGCHAHRADTHLSPTARCRTCHAPVAEVPALSVARIARFPEPAWHDAPDFASEHGRIAAPQDGTCGVCHARESCERCHANADRLTLITGLARDQRIAALALTKAAVYPEPASHNEDWPTTHGTEAARSTASCANCHTRPGCQTCHADGVGTSRVAILALPGPGVRAGLGVPAARIARAVHGADVLRRHGSLAASNGMDCVQCHSEATCTACHAGSDSKRFHADNFVEKHAVDVFASSADCQSCHNTERFCRDCHARSGIAAESRMNAAFHTGKANWVLSHGQAARTGMESCAACHRQNDCVRCHSATGGWGVNPHRSGFRASGLAERNSASCRFCHIGRLPGGGS